MQARLFLIIALLSLVGCGQKGQLYIEADETVQTPETETVEADTTADRITPSAD